MKLTSTILGILIAFALLTGEPAPAAQSCNDDSVCTTTDMCSEGDCTGTPVNCPDDGNACTIELCSEDAGGCTTTPRVCDDFNTCTTDSCNPSTGCVYTPLAENAPCADDFQCTTNDRCRGTVPPFVPCTLDADCTALLSGNACQNLHCTCTQSNQCGLGRICSGGICVRSCTQDSQCQIQGQGLVCRGSQCVIPLSPPVCLGDALSDGSACPSPNGDQFQCTTNDRCQVIEDIPITGSTTLTLPIPICFGEALADNSDCPSPNGDGIACTINDRCQTESEEVEGYTITASICAGTPLCPDDGDLCTLELCNPVAQQCETVPVTCDEACQTTCNPETGECADKSNGTACNDGSVCTVNEACVDGACDGVPVEDVPTSTPTHTPTVGPSNTATHTAANTATQTHTPANTGTATRTPSSTPTFTSTATGASTATITATASATATQTETAVPEETPTRTETATEPPLDDTPTQTETPTEPTVDGTPTSTATETPAEPTETATPTDTAADPTSTSTETPTETRPASTPTSTATHTPTPVDVCPGDCDGNDEVSVDELVKSVNIALGRVPVTDCPPVNTNGDNEVTIDELVRAVSSALLGCDFVRPTPRR